MSFYTIKVEQTIILPKKADNPAIIDLLNNYAFGIKWDIKFSDNENAVIIDNQPNEEDFDLPDISDEEIPDFLKGEDVENF